MDSILKNAVARRDAALAEAQRWDDFVRMYSELRGASPDQLIENIDPGTDQPRQFPKNLRVVTRKSFPDMPGGALQVTEDLALKIIQEFGRPVPTRELLVELEKRGLTVGGQDPASTLSARLSRAPRLENVRPEGWRERRKADGNVFD